MAKQIHPTAIVESGAELGEDVVIGAYAYVGAASVIGAGTVLHHHASVEGFTAVGASCEIFPFTCIGSKTQDLKYKGGRPGVRIGDRNVFREYVSVHAAHNRPQAFEAMHAPPRGASPDFRHFLNFVEKSERGVVAGR